VSAGIVKDHDGWIECERRPPGSGGGTIFRVFLPAQERDEVGPEPTAPPTSSSKVAESIEAARRPVVDIGDGR
jgi:hypothetical protein